MEKDNLCIVPFPWNLNLTIQLASLPDVSVLSEKTEEERENVKTSTVSLCQDSR